MLVLTRRAGESIMIDNEIELKVLKIRGSQVHLGIDAPKKSAVHRKEVWLKIHGEPKAAGLVTKQGHEGSQVETTKERPKTGTEPV
jgi:carbon storage regulator|tara:strand:+ start:5447 stop:5704 length:258 start_codon:yes stop_codon:yes gene_type:complete